MNLEEKFSKLIKEELPGKVGKELQEVLLQAEKDAKELEECKEYNKQLIKEKESLKFKISELNAQIDSKAVFEAKLTNLEERERDLKVTQLELQLGEANKRADMVKEFTSGLVRNTVFKRNIFDSENKNVPYVDQYGNSQTHYVNNTKNLNETSEET